MSHIQLQVLCVTAAECTVMCHFVAGLCCEEGAIRHSGGYLEQVMQSHRTTFPHTVFTGRWLHFIPVSLLALGCCV